MSKSLNWYLRRHPVLYKIRFRLVSKNSSIAAIENFCYNDINKKENIPNIFFELNNTIFPNKAIEFNDSEKINEIAIWLRNNVKGGPGLGKSSATALQKMMNGEGGVCSDLSQVFNNFCVINDLKVKEWGIKNMSNNSNTKGGHSFNEVYDKELQKWIMIDVAKSIYFYDNTSKIPLSALEMIHLKKENKEIFFQSYNTQNHMDENNISDIYLTSNSFPFLITNYCNKTYDLFLENLDFFPESIIHGILILIGKSYVFEFPKND